MSNTIQFNATPDLQKQCGMWLESLSVENRLSPHTVTSYARDLTQFLDFWPTIMPAPRAGGYVVLQLADLRAFLAARRHSGAQSRLEPRFRACAILPASGTPRHAGKSGL